MITRGSPEALPRVDTSETGKYGELRKDLQEDFEKFVQDNPPITEPIGGPKDILKLPSSDRKDALAVFKQRLDDRLFEQRRPLARCILHLEQAIMLDNDIPKEELLRIIDQFAETYLFFDMQKTVLTHAVEEYYSMRRRVLAVREKFPNDVDLVNVFIEEKYDKRLDQDTPLSVSVGPMSIDVLLHREGMYSIFGDTGVVGITSWNSLSEFDDGSLIPLVFINQDADDEVEEVLRHEYMHVQSQMSMDVLRHHFSTYFKAGGSENRFGFPHSSGFAVRLYRALLDNVESLSEDEREYKRELLYRQVVEPLLLDLQKFALYEMKGEIFSSALSGDLDGIPEHLFENDSYDFLREEKEYFERELPDDERFQGEMLRYLEIGYRIVLEDAFRAYRQLVTSMVEKGDYADERSSVPEVNALLVDVPMQEWTQVIDRLLEREKK